MTAVSGDVSPAAVTASNEVANEGLQALEQEVDDAEASKGALKTSSPKTSSQATSGYAGAQRARPKAASKGSSAIAHPLFLRAAEKAKSGVFESSPEKKEVPSESDVHREVRTVFESEPRAKAVDASSRVAVSHAEKARELIEQAADATVFESKPQQRSADVSASQPVAVSNGSNVVFESKPVPSKADALHNCSGAGTLAAAAEELILSAAEQWSGAEAADSKYVFESRPAPSSASANQASRSDSGAASTSVFESKPSCSTADVRSAKVDHAAAAKALIDRASEEAEGNCLSKSDFSSREQASRARQVIQEAAASHDRAQDGSAAAFVFESKPTASTAVAKHGEAYESEEEWEYEEEEEEQEQQTTAISKP